MQERLLEVNSAQASPVEQTQKDRVQTSTNVEKHSTNLLAQKSALGGSSVFRSPLYFGKGLNKKRDFVTELSDSSSIP